MAIHSKLAALAVEAIDEYLAIAEHCVRTQKSPGAIYGYPATLLLFCVVDAVTLYLGGRNNTFTALNTPPFGLSLTNAQLKRLAEFYRNLLAHTALIAPGELLTPEPAGAAFEFNADNEPTRVRVPVFFNCVKKAWEAFDKAKLRPEDHLQKKHIVAAPIDLSGASTAFSTAASGAIGPPSKVK